MTVKAKKNNNKAARGKNARAGNVKRSAAEEMEMLAKAYRLKPKTKAMIDDMLNDPKLTQREAYMRHHKTTNLNTVDRALNRTMKKPSVIGYKASAVAKAKKRMIELVDSTNESIAVKASQDIIDRAEGKAIQKNEIASTVIEVKLDLGGVRLGNHFLPAPSTPALPDGIVAQ